MTADHIISSAIAIPSAQSPLSFMINNNNNNINNNNPNIRYETYKALLGETVRLECPQPNPTWFFRRLNSDNSKSSEDLIVTRHGIINADYKYKIMCHVTLKHQVIIINNIDFDEEGLYTCLYTQPLVEAPFQSKGLGDISGGQNSGPAQYRYVFNVTVYSKFFSVCFY